jgi:hypothetical protein
MIEAVRSMVDLPALEAKLKAFSKRSKISDAEIIDCLVLHKRSKISPSTLVCTRIKGVLLYCCFVLHKRSTASASV